MDADAIFNSARVNEGKKRYSAEDLQTDIRSVLTKFVSKGGVGLKSLSEPNLRKGPIASSRYRDEILAALSALVLEEHSISGGLSGYNIRADVEDAVKFFAANNVFVGRVREAFDRLKTKLNLE
jgi:hypothetical protein